VHFAHHGNVRHRQLADQAAQALCLTLVINCVAAFNAGLLGPAIEQLQADCFEVDDDDVSHLGPTMTEHINVHGRYHFKLDQVPKGPRSLRQAPPAIDLHEGPS
jgi:hypothetical protein